MKTFFFVRFLASHVILRTVKAVPEYGKGKQRRSTVGGEVRGGAPFPQATNDDENANKVNRHDHEGRSILSSLIRPRTAVVRALASHQCGPGSIPGPGVISGLSLLLVLYSAPRGFSLGSPVFPLLKDQHFQIPIRSGNARTCSKRVLENF